MGKKVSVIIPAQNEQKQIGTLVRTLRHWYRNPEIIVVANGCTDQTVRIAKQNGARVLEFAESLGPDVGRAIGMSAAEGDILVVTDADMVVRPEELEPFIEAVEDGVDIALNRYPFKDMKQYHHPTAIGKQAVNVFLDRADLRASSLTTIPHAISRKALQTLGAEAFVVPPVAQAQAILMGLSVERAGFVHVGRRNRARTQAHYGKMRRLILGDCLEAIYQIALHRGSRGGFTDLYRRRYVLEDLLPSAHFLDQKEAVLAVIPAQSETTLGRVIRTICKAHVDGVCVIQNGVASAFEQSKLQVPLHLHFNVDTFSESLGHDVGRAIGCLLHPAERYLFADADLLLHENDLSPFVEALSQVDVALNRLDEILTPNHKRDATSVVKRFLNLALHRPDLGIASLTAVPHALRDEVVQDIGYGSLVVPPLAQVKAILAGYRVEAVHAVDVIKSNLRRPQHRTSKHGNLVEKMIVGDHFEAIFHLQHIKGSRAGYEDSCRMREMALEWKKHRILP